MQLLSRITPIHSLGLKLVMFVKVMCNIKEMKVNASTWVPFTNTFNFDVQISNFVSVRLLVLINPHSNSLF